MLESRSGPSSDGAASTLASGIAAYDAGRFAQAAQSFREALAAGAEPVRGWTNLGAALNASGCSEEAIACYHRARAHDPECAETLGNLGNALLVVGELALASENLARAAALVPAEPRWWSGLGVALLRERRIEAAMASFDEGLAHCSADPQLEFLRSCALLQLERYTDAWPGYDRRFDCGEVPDRGFDAPAWDGAPLRGRTLLLFAEQGHGDLIQFARFLPDVIGRAHGRVIVEVLPNLRRLFTVNFPEVEVIAVGDEVPSHDVCLPLLSTARMVGGNARTGVRADGSYLGVPSPAPSRVWAASSRSLRVGLVWKGNPRPWDRSCPLSEILSLLEVAGVDLVSLQRGGAREIARLGASALIEDATQGLSDFLDDAELVADLDLVLSVDTSTAHLAGALGKPVWALLTHRSDWRYPSDGEATPWYPSMRLFRQQCPGDWRSTIARVREALQSLAAARHRPLLGLTKIPG